MKLFFVIITLLFAYGSDFRNKEMPYPAPTCDSVPELNKKIIAFVKTKLNKKVGRGECWDLAAEALNSTQAKWDGNYVFGKEVNYKKDCVYPGDEKLVTEANRMNWWPGCYRSGHGHQRRRP